MKFTDRNNNRAAQTQHRSTYLQLSVTKWQNRHFFHCFHLSLWNKLTWEWSNNTFLVGRQIALYAPGWLLSQLVSVKSLFFISSSLFLLFVVFLSTKIFFHPQIFFSSSFSVPCFLKGKYLILLFLILKAFLNVLNPMQKSENARLGGHHYFCTPQ